MVGRRVAGMGDLVGDVELAASPVVANSTMNRERTLTGVNGYARELGFDPAERLRGRPGAWLDLCSGRGGPWSPPPGRSPRAAS